MSSPIMHSKESGGSFSITKESSFQNIFDGLIRERDLKRRTDRMNQAMVDFNPYFIENPSRKDGAWRINPKPLLLNVEEWDWFEQVCLQRFKVYNSLLADLYGDQNILRSRVLPPKIIFSDPSFLIPLKGKGIQSEMNNGSQSIFASFDFVKLADGRWLVRDQNYSVPKGLSRLLQIRRLVGQFFPEYFHHRKPESITGAPGMINEVFSSGGISERGGSDRQTVILCDDKSEDDWFEEGTLGRLMGVPVVKNQDLVMRDQCIFLRTIEGLKQVGNIFRRTENGMIDPVAFGDSSQTGVPGIIHSIRENKVIVLNSFGSEIINNKALMAFDSEIHKFYGEPLVGAPCLPTLHHLDYDQSEEILSNPDNYNHRRTHYQPTDRWEDESIHFKDHFDSSKRSQYIAHPKAKLSREILSNGKASLETEFSIRLFMIGGDSPRLVPGGLGFFESVNNGELPNGLSMKFLCDVWSPEKEAKVYFSIPNEIENRLEMNEFPLSSRIAEQLYWLGRYTERSEHSARLINIYVESFKKGGDQNEDNFLERTIDGLNENDDSHYDSIKDPIRRVTAILNSQNDFGSVRYNMSLALKLASELRGTISPEYFDSISTSVEILDTFRTKKRIHPADIETITRKLLRRFLEMSGSADRTFVRDSSWFFYKSGLLLERAIYVLNLLSNVIPRAGRFYNLHRVDDSDLIYLLRMSGSLDSYNRSYRSRAFLDRIIHLLIKSETATSSVRFACFEIQEHLKAKEFEGLASTNLLQLRLDRIIDKIEIFHVDDYLKWQGLSKANQDDKDLSDIEGLLNSVESLKAEFGGFHSDLESSLFHHQLLGYA